MRIGDNAVTSANVGGIKKAVMKAIDSGDAVLDLSECTRVDSTALALILAARRRAAARGLELEIKGAPASIEDLARVYGLESLLQPK